MKAQRGTTDLALTLSLDPALDGVGDQGHAPAALPPGKTLYPCTAGRVSPRVGLHGCGKSPHNGIRSPDRPACSESLYQLHVQFKELY